MQTERLLPEDLAGDDSKEGLRRQRDFYKHLVESIVEDFPDPVGIVDADGIITGWNPELGDLVGLPGEEVYGEQAYDVVGTEGEDEVLSEKVARLGETIVEDEPRVGETEDGGLWAVQASGFPLTDPDGETIGAFQINTVITDIVKKNRELSEVQDRITDEVAIATGELSDTLQETADHTSAITSTVDNQTETIDEIRTELTDVSRESEEVAQRAQLIQERGEKMQDDVDSSRDAARSVAESIEEAAEAGETVEQVAEELETQAEEITQVTETIADIAEQTNLLALNANIEAARAGSGSGGGETHGFEVVANEVKALATQSQDEAGKVRNRIQAIQTNIEETVEGIGELQGQLDSAVDESHELTEKQDSITEHVHSVMDEMTGVAGSVESQSTKIQHLQGDVDTFADRTEKVSDRISEIAATTQEQTATVTELDDAVQELAEQLGQHEL